MSDWLKNMSDPDGAAPMRRRFQEMLADGRHVFDSAIAVILSSGDPADVREDVFKTDRRINRNEMALRRELVVHATVHGPNGFPMALVLMSIGKDAERIGDYAKNLLDLAVHSSGINDEERECIRLRAAETSELLLRAASVFDSQDEEAARKFLLDEQDVRRACETQVSTWLEDSSRNRAAACLCLRFMKRVAGHSGNVVSSVCMPLDKLDFHPGGGGDED
jgi:phosphate uptake regulator